MAETTRDSMETTESRKFVRFNGTALKQHEVTIFYPVWMFSWNSLNFTKLKFHKTWLVFSVMIKLVVLLLSCKQFSTVEE